MDNDKSTFDYQMLFEKWADFADSEAPDEVTQLVEEHGLQPLDAISFMAFCYGAAQLKKEA